MSVYVLKEVNTLDNGEHGFTVTLCDTEEIAIDVMEKQIEQYMDNYNAEITYGKIGDLEVDLIDEENNIYQFEIEVGEVIHDSPFISLEDNKHDAV